MRDPILRSWRCVPLPIRFLARHVAIGFGLAALFVGGLLVANPNGAGTVLLTAADHWWPALALWGVTGLTFGAVQFGAATMLLGSDRDRPRGGRRVPIGLAPLRVPVRARQRR